MAKACSVSRRFISQITRQIMLFQCPIFFELEDWRGTLTHLSSVLQVFPDPVPLRPLVSGQRQHLHALQDHRHPPEPPGGQHGGGLHRPDVHRHHQPLLQHAGLQAHQPTEGLRLKGAQRQGGGLEDPGGTAQVTGQIKEHGPHPLLIRPLLLPPNSASPLTLLMWMMDCMWLDPFRKCLFFFHYFVVFFSFFSLHLWTCACAESLQCWRWDA